MCKYGKVFLSCPDLQLGKVIEEAWPGLTERFETAMDRVDASVKHVLDLAEFERMSERKIDQLRREEELFKTIPSQDEFGDFPCKILPQAPYQGFFGRTEALDFIRGHLDPAQSNGQLQSVLVHGLGGVGKTQIALTYAHKMTSAFDAVFWIRSETPEAIRQSFTNAACALELPGARRSCDDESNLLVFQKWLRQQNTKSNGNKLDAYIT